MGIFINLAGVKHYVLESFSSQWANSKGIFNLFTLNSLHLLKEEIPHI